MTVVMVDDAVRLYSVDRIGFFFWTRVVLDTFKGSYQYLPTRVYLLFYQCSKRRYSFIQVEAIPRTLG